MDPPLLPMVAVIAVDPTRPRQPLRIVNSSGIPVKAARAVVFQANPPLPAGAPLIAAGHTMISAGAAGTLV
jgi:hypothetical protein